MLLTNNKDNMMIKNPTKFVVIAAIGLSLSSGLSQTALMTMDSADNLIIMSPRVTAPSRLGLGTFAVFHNDEDGFSVLNKGTKHIVQNHLVAKTLRGIHHNDLRALLGKNVHLFINRGSDGKFSLRESGGLDGGEGTGSDLGKNAGVGSIEAFKKLLEDHPNLMGALLGPIGLAGQKLGDAWMVTNQLAATAGPYISAAGPYIWAAGTYTMYVGVGGAAGVGLYYGVPRAYNAYQRSYNPTLKQQNEHLVQQLRLNYNTCILKNPLKEGTFGIPFACVGHFNKLKMVTDAMKMSEATQLVENEHNVQQLRLNYSTCILTHPIAEDPGEISPACIGLFNKFKKVADAMKMHENTTQN